MSSPSSTRRNERGTAVTETLLLTWILVVFIAGAFQLFRVNQALYSSITAAHMLMFKGAFAADCYQKTATCIYNSDLHAQVKWEPVAMPEVLVPTVGMFTSKLGPQLRLKAWSGAASPRQDGIKRTRMGAGTYYPICGCAGFGGCMNSLKSVPGMGVC